VKLSVIILSRDGRVDKKIVKSVDFADEIIIWDELTHPFTDFSAHRNSALAKAKNNWVLFIDDDEYVGTELAEEIKHILKNSCQSGYLIPRRDIIFGDLISHGETSNIYLLRLARKDSGKFVRPVHERWEVNGPIAKLNNPIYHIKDNFISEFIGRTILYGLLTRDHFYSKVSCSPSFACVLSNSQVLS
jgi:hypothetical protein